MVTIIPVFLALLLVLASCTGSPAPGANAKTIPVNPPPTTSQPTTTPPTTQPPPTSYPEGYDFYAAPSNPKNDLEVIVAFAFLLDAGKYKEAEQYCSQSFMQGLINYRIYTLENWWKQASGGRKLSIVSFLYYQSLSDTKRIPKMEFFFADRTAIQPAPTLIKENGKWLISGE